MPATNVLTKNGPPGGTIRRAQVVSENPRERTLRIWSMRCHPSAHKPASRLTPTRRCRIKRDSGPPVDRKPAQSCVLRRALLRPQKAATVRRSYRQQMRRGHLEVPPDSASSCFVMDIRVRRRRFSPQGARRPSLGPLPDVLCTAQNSLGSGLMTAAPAPYIQDTVPSAILRFGVDPRENASLQSHADALLGRWAFGSRGEGRSGVDNLPKILARAVLFRCNLSI